MIRKVFSILFVGILIFGFFINDSFNQFPLYHEYITSSKNVSKLNNQYTESFWNFDSFVDLNGYVARQLQIKGFYGDMGMYVINGNYIVSQNDATSTDYEYEQVVSFMNFLNENGIQFLYVNQPTKYLDDSIFKKSFGVESYCNRNADVFLKRIREAGVPTIDLRDNIESENKNIYDMFYRTDHHWKTTTGLWASKIIAQGLNDYCGYSIDTSIYDESNFDMKVTKDCWVGEQGHKVGGAYVGTDDYVVIKPKFDTNYTFKTKKEVFDGTFDDFILEDTLLEEGNPYHRKSWYYAYDRKNCINHNVQNGKVLMLCDSYAHVTEPFLSLGVHDISSMILRNKSKDFDLKQYILENEFDTVIVCYAEFMIGAHDNESSANYKMFRFMQ